MIGITRRVEDYLRSIYEIVERKGFARIKDIASDLDVKPSSVVDMVRRLHKMNLVLYEKYGGIRLTKKGMEIARAVKKRHETFRRFLEIILVPRDIALRDAHVLEHMLHPKTVLQFSKFVEFITGVERPQSIRRWMEEFKRYCDRMDEECSE